MVQFKTVTVFGPIITGRRSHFSRFQAYFGGVLLLILLAGFPKSCVGYYVGPEVGNAPSETRVVKTRGLVGRNVTSLAEAAYVPYVYSVGNNVVTFLRSIIPALQPKVDFFADQIQDGIDTANSKLMQKLENSSNGIIAVENFFTGLMKAFVFGKGPEEEERRKRLAEALIRSGMLDITTLGTTTTTSRTIATATTTTTKKPKTSKIPEQSVTESLVTGATTSTTVRSTSVATNERDVVPTSSTTSTGKPFVIIEDILSNDLPLAGSSKKARDNNFNKMRVVNIVKNLL